jgi:hypothetical protein
VAASAPRRVKAEARARTATRRVLRDDVLEAEFHREGLIRTSVLDEDGVAAALEAFGRLRPADGFAPVGAVTYHCTFLDTDETYRREVSALARELLSPAVERVLADFDVLQAHFYVKPPGEGHFDLHQNWPMVELDDTSVTLWCPLVDVDRENGTLEYVPGSHKLLPHVQGPYTASYFDEILPEVWEATRAVPLAAGEGAIFDDGLIHGSRRNTSDRPRIALQVICTPRDATPIFFFPTGPRAFERIEAPSEFWLAHAYEDLGGRQPAWSGAGFVRSENRGIGYAELQQLIDDGRAGRRDPLVLATIDRPSPGWRDAARRVRSLARRAGLRRRRTV